MRTFEAAAEASGGDFNFAISLYAWNARVCAILLAPLHLCEVIIRNAVSEAIEAQFGPRWPWAPGFEQSLPDPASGYSPRKDLRDTRRTNHRTGCVIAELKFVFWQKMFTKRYENQIWRRNLRQVMPHLDAARELGDLRQALYDDLGHIRKLRNRVAHHEPIFSRALSDDLLKILGIVSGRCDMTAELLLDAREVEKIIQSKPKKPAQVLGFPAKH